MARRVFFSFEYSDIWRVNQVRNSWVTRGIEPAGFLDKAEFESIQKHGDAAIARWIDQQLHGTSGTVVLVGAYTCASRWVNYEIEASKAKGNGLLGIDISMLQDQYGYATTCCGPIPYGYNFYNWSIDDGYNNLGHWAASAYLLANPDPWQSPVQQWPR